MIPAANIVVVSPPPTTLVNTPLPDTIAAVRVPPDNITPSFSNVQINNNARGNSGALVLAETPPPAAAASVSAGAVATGGSLPGYGAPATFLAQLIGQNIAGAPLNGYLQQYETMIRNSLVKYGNSGAFAPPPQPSAYEKFVAQQRLEQPSAPQQARLQPAPEASTQTQPALPIAAAIAAAPQRSQPVQVKPQAATPESKEAPPSAPIKLAQAPAAIPSQAANAYQASAARIDAAAPQATTV